MRGSKPALLLSILLLAVPWAGLGSIDTMSHDMTIHTSVGNDVSDSTNFTTVFQLNIPDDGSDFNSFK